MQEGAISTKQCDARGSDQYEAVRRSAKKCEEECRRSAKKSVEECRRLVIIIIIIF
jgi:hypothetical protein